MESMGCILCQLSTVLCCEMRLLFALWRLYLLHCLTADCYMKFTASRADVFHVPMVMVLSGIVLFSYYIIMMMNVDCNKE